MKILRSDNAKEYFSSSFTNFMTEQDIIQQFSCAYTPQQIGITACKNRHLFETACTLLFHRKVPKFFGVMQFLEHVI